MIDVDAIAGHLAHYARVARALPPAWKTSRVSQPLVGPRGQRIGRMLPGHGLYLDCDAKALGITRKIPGVTERTPMARALEILRQDKGAFTSAQSWKTAYANGMAQQITAYRGAIADTGLWSDLFAIVDSQGNVNALPTGALDQTTAGAMSGAMIAPSGSNTAYLLSFGLNPVGGGGGTPNGYNLSFIADLLVSVTGLDCTTNAAQTVATAALTRYTTGAGVLIALEATAGGSVTNFSPLSLSYTNQAGAGSRTTPTQNIVNVAGAGLSILFDSTNTFSLPYCTLQAGDSGVQSVQSVTYAGTTGSQPFAVVLMQPLLWVGGTNAADDYLETDTTATIAAIVPLQTSSGKLGCLSVFVSSPSTAGGNPAANNLYFAVAQG